MLVYVFTFKGDGLETELTLHKPVNVVKREDLLRRWLVVPRPHSRPRIKLFCFSYAGGNASAYREWPTHFDHDVEVLAIQAPGRGSRIAENALTCIESMTRQIAEVIKSNSFPRFAFFGHSMGALLAFEVCRALRRAGAMLPEVLIVSGRQAPQLGGARENISALPEAAFLSRLEQLGGTPPDILSNPDMMSILLPSLRMDFKMLENWSYREEPALDLPIVACAGLRDSHVPVSAVEAWRDQTLHDFECWRFNGDHFFLHTQMASLTRKIRDRLTQAVCA